MCFVGSSRSPGSMPPSPLALDVRLGLAEVQSEALVQQQRAGQQAASHRTWKPLRMPSTGRLGREPGDGLIAGANRAIAPARR